MSKYANDFKKKQQSFELSCEATGLEISQNIAISAQGLGCEGVLDAALVYRRLTEISLECKAKFEDIGKLEEDAVESLAKDGRELADTLYSFELTGNVAKFACPAEFKSLEDGQKFLDISAKEMQENMIRSFGGSAQHLKFEKMAQQLHENAVNRGKSCNIPEAALSKISQNTKNQRVTGSTPEFASTITGKIKHEPLASEPPAILAEQTQLSSKTISGNSTLAERTPASGSLPPLDSQAARLEGERTFRSGEAKGAEAKGSSSVGSAIWSDTDDNGLLGLALGEEKQKKRETLETQGALEIDNHDLAAMKIQEKESSVVTEFADSYSNESRSRAEIDLFDRVRKIYRKRQPNLTIN